ncbi:MAG: hypothetical protein B6241_00615 [Spirochaetaceae bacterium 4572_59]|nr:MAG: hypothetical protein B6241_00615 [Spirochaetaceae bacterium 4572_59]
MKKILLLVMLLLIAGSLTAGDRYYASPFRWYSPEVQAQGGSFVANAEGFNALLSNPAAFAKSEDKDNKKGGTGKKGEITVLSISSSYSGNIFEFMEEYRSRPDDIIGIVLDQVTSHGIGAGFQIGSGYVGRGFGFGFMSVMDTNLPVAETTLGVTMDLSWTNGLVAGYAHPFNLNHVKLVVGADVRPMYRILIPGVDISSFTDTVSEDDEEDSGDDVDFSNIDAMAGIGVAVDAGADVYWQDLIFSLTMRDIGNTRFFFNPLNSLGGVTFSDNDDIDDSYITPWSLNFAVAYHPVFGKLNKYIDLTVHGAYSQPLIFEDNIYGYDSQSFWTKLDLGAEVILLSSVALRTGFQGGYFTAGFGLDLYFMELNGALYSEEVGSYAGAEPKMGGALEFAFRF